MPRLNAFGDVLMGAAGGPASLNGQALPFPAGVAVWADDEHIAAQAFLPAGPTVILYNIRTKQQTVWVPARGVNQLAGGGGCWVAADGVGVFGAVEASGYSLGLTDEDGRGSIGPDGTAAIVRHGGRGFELRALNGTKVTGPNVLARDLCVVGPGQVIWRDDAGRIGYFGIEPPVQLPSATKLRFVDVPFRTSWLLSFCGAIGLVAHPWDSLVGVRLTGIGENAFYPDARVVDGRLKVVWSRGPGELPGDLHVIENAFDLPRVDLTTLLAPLPPPIDPPPVDPPPVDPPEEPEDPPVSVPNYFDQVKKRGEQFPDYTNDSLTDDQRIAAAAKLTAIVAYDLYAGVGGAPKDPRVGLYRKGNEFGFDENRLLIDLKNGQMSMPKIVIQTGASWASLGWNDPDHLWPAVYSDGRSDGWMAPSPVPGVHDDAPPVEEPPTDPPPSGEIAEKVAALEGAYTSLRDTVNELHGKAMDALDEIGRKLKALEDRPAGGSFDPDAFEVKTEVALPIGRPRTFTGKIVKR